MKPFLQGEQERLQKALSILNTIGQKMRIIQDLPEGIPLVREKTTSRLEKQITAHYGEYEEAKAEILKYWESEETIMPEKTNMAIAEDFE